MILIIGIELNKLIIFFKINIEVCKFFYFDCYGSKIKLLYKFFVFLVELILK